MKKFVTQQSCGELDPERLNTVGSVSAKRVQEIAGSLFNLPISTGTVCKMLARCAEKSSDAVSLIKEKVKQLDSAHFDET